VVGAVTAFCACWACGAASAVFIEACWTADDTTLIPKITATIPAPAKDQSGVEVGGTGIGTVRRQFMQCPIQSFPIGNVGMKKRWK